MYPAVSELLTVKCDNPKWSKFATYINYKPSGNDPVYLCDECHDELVELLKPSNL
jgi:hypothetical protein